MAASTTHHAADFGAQRIVTLRIFDGNIHRLGLLALCEAAVVVLGLYAAIFIRFAGSLLGSSLDTHSVLVLMG